jgi:hypothetical protein
MIAIFLDQTGYILDYQVTPSEWGYVVAHDYGLMQSEQIPTRVITITPKQLNKADDLWGSLLQRSVPITSLFKGL